MRAHKDAMMEFNFRSHSTAANSFASDMYYTLSRTRLIGCLLTAGARTNRVFGKCLFVIYTQM